MRRHLLFIFAVCLTATFQVCLAAELSPEEVDSTDRTRQFFSPNGLKSCPLCRTLVIVVSNDRLSSELRDALRNMSTTISNDQPHEAALIRRSDLLLEQNILGLKALSCTTPTLSDKNVLYFVTVDDKQCIKVPYNEEATLRVALEKIYYHLNDPKTVAEHIEHLTFEEQVNALTQYVADFLGGHADQFIPLIKKAARYFLLRQRR